MHQLEKAIFVCCPAKSNNDLLTETPCLTMLPVSLSQSVQHFPSMMSPSAFEKFNRRLRRHLKPSKIGSTGAEKLHDLPTLATPSPALPASANPVEGPHTRPNDERPNETPFPPNLWQAAFSQLKEDKQLLLRTGLTNESVHCDRDTTSPKIEIALHSVIETVQEQYETRSLKNDNRLYKTAKQILDAALSLQQSISAVVACDPTGHVSTAWSIVSLGLMVCGVHMTLEELC